MNPLRFRLRRLLALSTGSLLVLTPAFVRAAEGGAAAEKAPHSPLEEQMETMGGSMRRLGRVVADPAKSAEALELLGKFRAAAVSARTHTPALAAEKPEAERAAFVAAYQKGIDQLVAKLDEIDAALKAGDAANAKKLFDELRGLQRSGHKEFKKPEKPTPAPAP